MILAWDAVLVDCKQNPEFVSHYEIMLDIAWPPTEWLILGTTSADTQFAELTGDPPVGEVFFFRVRTVDLAGHTSDEECPL